MKATIVIKATTPQFLMSSNKPLNIIASVMFIAISALTLLASSAAYSELSANAVLAAAPAADRSSSSSHIDAAHCFDMAAILPEAVSSPEPLTSTIAGNSHKHSRHNVIGKQMPAAVRHRRSLHNQLFQATERLLRLRHLSADYLILSIGTNALFGQTAPRPIAIEPQLEARK